MALRQIIIDACHENVKKHYANIKSYTKCESHVTRNVRILVTCISHIVTRKNATLSHIEKNDVRVVIITSVRIFESDDQTLNILEIIERFSGSIIGKIAFLVY